MSTLQNCNYRIGVDTLPSGKVRAKARGTRSTTRTLTPGTSHADAALVLAGAIEGERLSHVEMHSGHSTKSDWKVYVNAQNQF